MANPIEVIRINQGEDVEEVFLYRDEPYVNEVRYAKPGTYEIGPLPEEADDETEVDSPQEG